MSFLIKKNNSHSSITDNPLSSVATSVNITNGSGDIFPTIGDFMLTVWDSINFPDPGQDPNMEIMRGTARSGDVLTVIRGQEDTAAVEHAYGNTIAMLVTAGVFNETMDQDLKTTDSPIFNSITETNPTLLKLDQTTPQIVDNGRPILNDGIQFGAAPIVGSFSEGKMYYDTVHKTIAAEVDGDVTLQLGQEEHILVRNITGSDINTLQIVYISGGDIGLPTVSLAQANNYSSSNSLGVAIQTIINGFSGFVTVRGEIHNLDTTGTPYGEVWNSGDILYLSKTIAGSLTNVAPTSNTDIKVAIGRIITSHDTAGIIYISQLHFTRVTDLTDVDTETVVPIRDQVLKWNGSNWVPAIYSTSFAVAISSFTTNQAVTQLIGNGTWQASNAITFTTVYTNPPPDSASISLTSDGAVSWPSALTLYSPFTFGISANNTSYPNAKDKYVTFTLTAMDGVTPLTSSYTVTFRNYRFWGTLTVNTGITEANVESLSSELSNSPTGSKVISATSGRYLVWAYPSSYSSIHATGAIFNSVTCPFNTVATVSITNSAGYNENYKVYASTNSNLGNSTLVTSTSSNLINRLYYGVTTSTSGFTESQVEALVNNIVTNNNKQVWSSVTVGSGEYMLFAFPLRLGLVSFWVGGFEGGFQAPETVSITNINGYTEDYYVWRSDNPNLGVTSVTTTAVV